MKIYINKVVVVLFFVFFTSITIVISNVNSVESNDNVKVSSTDMVNHILYTSSDDTSSAPEIPEPVKIVDFSDSFEELLKNDPGFLIEDNAAKPELVYDEEMGQVLQLKEAVIKEQVFYEKDSHKTDYIQSDNSEYSTIHISNPFVGLEHLVEYEPYEDVKTIEYTKYRKQPLWEEGITISYWIKSPSTEEGYGVNSNVIGFQSERFQIEAADYGKYNATIRYDIESNKYTDSEKEILGLSNCGVDKESVFFFEYADEQTYEGKPLYKYETLGKYYYLNKYYEFGYVKYEDGTIKPCDMDMNTYEYYKEAPYLGNDSSEHNPGKSNLEYAWTYSEMWLDASSSFYFENDNEYSDIQLNSNVDSFGTIKGMQLNNRFNINSWNNGSGSIEDAFKYDNLCDSPVSLPNQWHYVTVVIQNDWVSYYLNGIKMDIVNDYSAFSLKYFPENINVWESFNKGTGARYGYGTKDFIRPFYSGRYTSTTIMEWITLECVDLTIGGGNRNGDRYSMYANTDEILIKNVVFYDKMLTDEQIAYLAEKPDFYGEIKLRTIGDVNADDLVNAEDALIVLKHAAGLGQISKDITVVADLDEDSKINAKDALEILKIAARISR